MGFTYFAKGVAGSREPDLAAPITPIMIISAETSGLGKTLALQARSSSTQTTQM